MIQLAVNIDHVATIRQARGESEPDPVAAAAIAELAGAVGIVCHLREDRRHVQDRDVQLLRQTVSTKLDLEMAANDEIIAFAHNLKPELVTLVPEKREELTTEGGLDVASRTSYFHELTKEMQRHSIEVSYFIEPDASQIEAVHFTGAEVVEFHTGTFANARSHAEQRAQLKRLQQAAEVAHHAGLRVTAGHGINYANAHLMKEIPHLHEVSIGHAIISRAVFSGLDTAVRDMIALLK